MADDSGDDLDSDPPGSADDADSNAESGPSEAWKERGYPEQPKWAPDCPLCGGPVIGFTVSGPMTSEVTPCGCEVPPSMIDL